MAKVNELLAQARTRGATGNRHVEDYELLSEMSHVQRQLMARWPERFAERVVVDAPGAGNPWELDDSFTQMIWIQKSGAEGAAGSPVAFLDVSRPDAEDPPAVYFIGPKFYSVGTDPDPATEDLIFVYGVVPTDLVADGSTHSLFPPEADQLLVLAGARYISAKAKQHDEADRFDGQFGRLRDAFDGQCSEWTRYVRGGADATSYRAFAPPPPVTDFRLVPARRSRRR